MLLHCRARTVVMLLLLLLLLSAFAPSSRTDDINDLLEMNPVALISKIAELLEEVSYNIPDPGEMNLTALMSAHGCEEFADALSASPDTLNKYEDNMERGLTVFCPSDGPFKAFRPQFNRLSEDGRASLLEFYCIAGYMPMSLLWSNSGTIYILATEGAKEVGIAVRNDGKAVALETEANTVRITGTVFDEPPLAIYSTDGVLLPEELEAAAGPVPAPSPAPVGPVPVPAPVPAPEKAGDAPEAADSPKPAKQGSPSAPDGDTAYQTDHQRASSPDVRRGKLCVVMFGLFSVAFLL